MNHDNTSHQHSEETAGRSGLSRRWMQLGMRVGVSLFDRVIDALTVGLQAISVAIQGDEGFEDDIHRQALADRWFGAAASDPS